MNDREANLPRSVVADKEFVVFSTWFVVSEAATNHIGVSPYQLKDK